MLTEEKHRLFDADFKAVHMHFHIVESRPEGPAEPLVLNTISPMDDASSDSNTVVRKNFRPCPLLPKIKHAKDLYDKY